MRRPARPLVGVLATLALACAGRRAPAPAALPAAGIPSGPAAEAYRAPGPRAPEDRDPLRKAVLAEVAAAAAAARRPPVATDARLDRVARDLLVVTPLGGLPPLDVLTFLMRHYGLPEPEPHVMVVQGGSGPGEVEISGRVRERLPLVFQQGRWDRAAVGISRDGPRATLLLLLQESMVELDPVPRRVRTAAGARVRGRVRVAARAPKLVITPPHGEVREVRADQGGGRFDARLACAEGDGEYQVEVAGEDATGPVVLANFPVYCGVAPPARPPAAEAEVVHPQEPEEAERELFDEVNRERARRGLRAVRWDRRLARIARAHSAEMAGTGQVAHVSPRTGTAENRVLGAGLAPSLIAENVGRAATAGQAHRGFMGSPGHRANVLDPKVTHVGIGVVEGAPELGVGRLFFTQLFAAGL